MDEGYVKYHCRWIQSAPIPARELTELNGWRQKLFQLGLIGAYENEVGFGNLSVRIGDSPQFIISGTQTGHLSSLNEYYYTQVVDYNFGENSLTCKGPVQASSESLTHAAFYTCNPSINAVVHIHNRELWKNLMYKVPTTRSDVRYGTPEMCDEVIRLYNVTHSNQIKLFVMSGHEDGLISYGNTLEEAGSIILDCVSQFPDSHEHAVGDTSDRIGATWQRSDVL